jgi:hypothetical protein
MSTRYVYKQKLLKYYPDFSIPKQILYKNTHQLLNKLTYDINILVFDNQRYFKNKLKYGYNIKKINNNLYHIIIKQRYTNYMYFDSYDDIYTYSLDTILINFYKNILTVYDENNVHNYNIALVLASITITYDKKQNLYNKIINLENINEDFIDLGYSLISQFVKVSKDLFNLEEKENIINFLNNNTVIVLKALKKYNLFDVTAYKYSYLFDSFLNQLICDNNYVCIQYILEEFKLIKKDILKINLTYKVIFQTLIYSDYESKFKLKARLKMYDLLLKYNFQHNNQITSLFCTKDILDSVQEHFNNTYNKFLHNFVNEIKLIFYPKDMLNIIFFYLK